MGLLGDICDIAKDLWNGGEEYNNDPYDNRCVIVHPDGVFFRNTGITIPWEHISSISLDEEKSLIITHRAGVDILISNLWGSLDKSSGYYICDNNLLSNKIEDKESTDSLEESVEIIENAVSAIEGFREFFDALENDTCSICFPWTAFVKIRDILNAYQEIDSVIYGEDNDNKLITDWISLSDRIKSLEGFIDDIRLYRSKFGEDDQFITNENFISLYAECKRHFLTGCSQYSFEVIRNCHDGDIEEKWIKWLDDCFNDSGSRKIIYCTERKESLRQVGETIDGMIVMRVSDIEKLIEFQSSEDPLDTHQGWRKTHQDMPITQAMAKAKEYKAAREARRLVFEMGHPRNETLYIQDPLQTNVYIDAESFHASMLERKYNELIRVLTALGATRISCIVENSECKEERGHNKYSVDGSFSYKAVKGSGHFSSDTSSSKITNLYKRLSVERILTPSKAIELPNDLVFYPFEQRWQDIAKLAKEGRLRKEIVDLTYRTDYAVTGKYLRDIGGKIETLIVGAEVAYSDEFEHELNELQSIVWHYEVEFGDMESVTPTEISEQVSLSAPTNVANSESDRARQILSKRIKRYAQSNNGLINQEQRADVESFAQKYGIDELELEEMIEEAI